MPNKTDGNQYITPKHLTILIMLYCTVLNIAAILAMYFGDIDGFIFTEGAAIMPVMYFIGDLITEVYGYSVARRAIWGALLSVIFFMLMIMLLVHVPPAPFWHLQHLYQFMYDRFYRVILCMGIFIPVSEFTNSYILSKLKILWRGRWLWVRSLTSSLTGELVIATLGNVTLFAGNYNLKQLLQVIFASFAIKAFFSMISAWPCALIANRIKRSEHIDIYDYNVNYNPFKLTTLSVSKDIFANAET